MMRSLDKIFILGVFFAVGFAITWQSKEFPMQKIAENNFKSSRDPAAIRKTYDFSHLQGSALDFAAKQRVLDGIQFQKNDREIGIELGHFVVKGFESNKVFACQKFSKVVLTFEGDGTAVAGELPQMEVEGPCEISADINRISPLWIPFAKFIKEPAADGEYDFKDDHPSRLKFINISGQWPRTWVLRSVRLVDQTGSNSDIIIPSQEMGSLTKKPLILSF